MKNTVLFAILGTLVGVVIGTLGSTTITAQVTNSCRTQGNRTAACRTCLNDFCRVTGTTNAHAAASCRNVCTNQGGPPFQPGCLTAASKGKTVNCRVCIRSICNNGGSTTEANLQCAQVCGGAGSTGGATTGGNTTGGVNPDPHCLAMASAGNTLNCRTCLRSRCAAGDSATSAESACTTECNGTGTTGGNTTGGTTGAVNPDPHCLATASAGNTLNCRTCLRNRCTAGATATAALDACAAQCNGTGTTGGNTTGGATTSPPFDVEACKASAPSTAIRCQPCYNHYCPVAGATLVRVRNKCARYCL